MSNLNNKRKMKGDQWFMFRIFEDMPLNVSLVQQLKDSGATFMVKETLDMDLKPVYVRPHYQGLAYGRYNTFHLFIPKAGYKTHAMYGLTRMKQTSQDVHDTLAYLCKGSGPEPDAIIDVQFNMKNYDVADSHHKFWALNKAISKLKKKAKNLKKMSNKDRCYEEAIKGKLNSNTHNTAIGVEILKWYGMNDIQPPLDFAMNGMIAHFAMRLARDDDDNNQTYEDLFARLYPRIDR